MLRIITLNLNGIRSALAKGFPRWLARQRADVVCLQEVKAQEADLAGLALVPKGYRAYYDCCSTKKGYSGVALYSRAEPESVCCGFGSREFDPEGRLLRADFGGLSAVSERPPKSARSNLPSGSNSAGFPWCRYTCLRGPARRRGRKRNSGSSENSCRC